MDPERWKRIDSLFDAVVERPPAEHEDFLRQACAGDDALEREVRSLLASHNQARSFLKSSGAAAELAELHESTVTHLAGRTISHYRVLEMLGAGGMGVVYKAFDTKLNRPVALKFLPPHLRHNAELKQRLKEEARAASTLDHPNIVVIHDIDEDSDGDLFIAMAFHEGVTLRDRIAAAKGRGLPVSEALQIARQIAAGLAKAHERGILHRDIKPGNIIVDKDGVARIIDFGLAKSSDATATLDGSTKGTPLYMSPEQASGKPLDARTDLWSLGALLYEMLAGSPPFTGDGHLQIMRAIVQDSPPGLRELRPDLPPEVDRIVSRALEKDPAQRYGSAVEMVRDLSAALTGTEGAAYLASTRRPLYTRRKVLAAAGVAVALGVAGYLYFPRAHKLTNKDTIVLADFTNKTGDPAFDGTLRQGLTVELEQSPFLSLISDERVQETLGMMGRPADAPITPQLAKEICERTGGAAVLDGRIDSMGSRYVLGLRARNCRTGEVLDEEQGSAGRKEDVLNALSQIASKFRTRVGESLATVKKYSTPLEDASTPSLDALKAYSLAINVAYSNGFAAGLTHLKRAVAIDPKFARAYAHLGMFYAGAGQFAQATESFTKAYLLRERANERDRFFIEANYYLNVTGDLDMAQKTCEAWAQAYSRDQHPHGLLSALIYQQLGKYEKSIAEGKIAIAIDAGFTPGYVNEVWSYIYLDRLAEAETGLRQLADRKLEIEDVFLLRYYVPFLKGDKSGMERAAALARGSPAEDWILDAEAFVTSYAGHLKEARDITRRAVDMADRSDHKEKSAIYKAGAAVREAFFGYFAEAREGAEAALKRSNNRDVEYGAAFALALARDLSRAKTLADDLEKRFPEDTLVRFTYLPAIRGILALNAEQPQRAIALLQAAVPYDLAIPGSWFGFFGYLYPAYVRGEAYLEANRGSEAAAEFQKILDHRGLVFTDPVDAAARIRLAKALVMVGDMAKAKAVYQDFFALWKDADRDIPLLKQAQAEYAKLQ